MPASQFDDILDERDVRISTLNIFNWDWWLNALPQPCAILSLILGLYLFYRMRILAAMILQSRTVCGVPLSLTFDNSQDAAVFQSVVSNSTITEMVVENWHLSAGQVVILLHRCRHSRDGLRQNCLFGAIHSSAASDFPFRLLVDAVTHVFSVFRVCKVP